MDNPSSSDIRPLLGSLPNATSTMSPSSPPLEVEDSALLHDSDDDPTLSITPTMPVNEYRKGDSVAGSIALAGVSSLAVVSWILVLFNHPFSLGWFAFHPTFQTLAIALFAFGIITLQPTSQPKTKAAGLARHQLIMLGMAFPIITFGTGSIIHNKNLHEAPHFVSWHGTFGIITYTWIIGQIAIGAGSVWGQGTLFGGGAKAKAVWKYHRASGYVLFFLLLTTAYLGGMFSTWAGSAGPYALRLIAYTVAPMAALGAIYFRIRTSKMKFV